MDSIHKFVALVLVYCAGLVSAPALANEAKEFYNEGVAAFEEENFTEAATAFRAAHKAKPSWKLYFNIGQSEAAAKNYGPALEAFEKYLTQGGDDIPESWEEEVLRELERLRKLVGYVAISAPADHKIIVNGTFRGTSPLGTEIALAIGTEHEIEIAGSEINQTQTISVRAGETRELSFKEEQVEEAAPVETDVARERNSLAMAGWITAGTGSAILITAGVLGGLALKKDRELECPGNVCTGDDWDTAQSMKKMGLTADIMYGVGGAAVAAGLIMLIVGIKKEKATAEITPVVGNGVAGLQVGGTF